MAFSALARSANVPLSSLPFSSGPQQQLTRILARQSLAARVPKDCCTSITSVQPPPSITTRSSNRVAQLAASGIRLSRRTAVRMIWNP